MKIDARVAARALRVCDAEAIRSALSRDAQGRALGPLGVALDVIATERGR
jgi:hypothetical protein